MAEKEFQKNVLGEKLESCSLDPLTGWHRDGCCNTDDMDHGVHTVCAKVTNKFLEWSKINGNDLNLSLGFSHNVVYKFPKEVNVLVEKQTIIKLDSSDKQLVGKVAAEIKALKPVEPYKAKGIKESGQYVLRKEGKKK